MVDNIVGILIGVVIVVYGAYRMWKIPGSNRKYIFLAMIGLIIMLGGFVLAQMLQLFHDLRYITLVGGMSLALFACYKHYVHRTSSSKKKR